MVTPAWAQRALNFAASSLFVGGAFLVYRLSPHAAGLREFTNQSLGLSGANVLSCAYLAYSLILFLFYFSEPAPRPSKSIAALRGLRMLLCAPWRTFQEGLPPPERLGLMTLLVKGFFGPLMLLSLFQFSSNMVANGLYLIQHAGERPVQLLLLFNSHGFWFLWHLILFLDVFFFTLGYLIEHPVFKNEIRSVDPSWLGWAVTLACYPPFNQVTSRLLGGNIADFPHFDNPVLHVSVNLVMLGLMAIFASASVALNWKASNLTHRGIVAHGPYRFVRHPAYTAKNLAWWLGALPAILDAWEWSGGQALVVAFSVVGWSTLYVARALTEEAHLRKVDGDYDAYCARVRFRFIPGLF